MPQYMKRRYLAVAAISLGAAGPMDAQDVHLPPGVRPLPSSPTMIIGIVVDRATSPSQPLEGVAVTIRGTDRTVITGDDGIFSFDSLPPGKYQVRARRIGYEPRVAEASLPDAGNVIFVLTPLSRALA